MEWELLDRVFKEYGIPGVAMLIGFYFATKTGKFLGPIVTKISEAHIGLIGTLQNNSERQTELLETLTHTTDKSRNAMVCESRALDQLSPDDRKDRVKHHTDEMRRVLNSET